MGFNSGFKGLIKHLAIRMYRRMRSLVVAMFTSSETVAIGQVHAPVSLPLEKNSVTYWVGGGFVGCMSVWTQI